MVSRFLKRLHSTAWKNEPQELECRFLEIVRPNLGREAYIIAEVEFLEK
jgi:hypothetical protein